MNNDLKLFSFSICLCRKLGLRTVDLIVLTSLDQLLLIMQTKLTFYKTSYLNEVNRTEPYPSASVSQV